MSLLSRSLVPGGTMSLLSLCERHTGQTLWNIRVWMRVCVCACVRVCVCACVCMHVYAREGGVIGSAVLGVHY